MKLILTMLWLMVSAPLGHAVTLHGEEYRDFTRLVLSGSRAENWAFQRLMSGYKISFSSDAEVEQIQSSLPIELARIYKIVRHASSLSIFISCICTALASRTADGNLKIDIFELKIFDPDYNLAPYDHSGGVGIYDEGYFSLLGVINQASLHKVLYPLRKRILVGLSFSGDVFAFEQVDLWKPEAHDYPSIRNNSRCPDGMSTDVGTWSSSLKMNGYSLNGNQKIEGLKFPSDVMSAAERYVSLGFGAEAMSLLSLVPDDDKNSDFIRVLAGLVDLVPLSKPQLARYSNCSGPIVLWAAVEQSLSTSDLIAKNFDVLAIVSQLDALPLHLRKSLGPPLARWLMKRGDYFGAGLLLASIKRAYVHEDSIVSLLEVEILLAASRHAEAVEKAIDLVAALRPHLQGQGLRLLVEAARLSGQQVPEGTAGRIEALLGQASITGDTMQMREAHLLALAMEGEYSQAFSLLSEAPGALSALWEFSVDAMPADDFLRQAVASTTVLATEREKIGDLLSLKIAQRLRNLGFAEASLEWVRGMDVNTSPSVRELMASAHLKLRDPAAVLAISGPLDAPIFSDMRAQAWAQLGEMQLAAEEVSDLGNAAGGERYWRWAGNWAEAVENSPQAWRSALDLNQAGVPQLIADAPLATGAAQLRDSEIARSAIISLLSSAQMPSANPP